MRRKNARCRAFPEAQTWATSPLQQEMQEAYKCEGGDKPRHREVHRGLFREPACVYFPLRASFSVGSIFNLPEANWAARSSTSFATAAGTTGLNLWPSACASFAPVTGGGCEP